MTPALWTVVFIIIIESVDSISRDGWDIFPLQMAKYMYLSNSYTMGARDVWHSLH